MTSKAVIVAGLGFGDEGKGTVVEFLTRHHKAHTVVRYNGGAQCAHNVVLKDGRHHTFSQFGCGTFEGARTYLSEHVLVNPFALLSEAKHLASIGVSDPLSMVTVDGNARITTPYHIASNRLQEMGRHNARHGSCGMGIGETMRLATRQGVSLLAKNLSNRSIARDCLEDIRANLLRDTEHLRKTLPSTNAVLRECYVLEQVDLDFVLDTYEQFSNLVQVQEDYREVLLRKEGTLIFEGAQGMLLDQDFGFHPHTTWTDITFRNAKAILNGFDVETTTMGVLRAHMTRHGAGPFPTELPGAAISTDHNHFGEWQQNFRVGYLDLVLARYAIEALGGVDEVAMTHLDLFENFPLFCCDYNGIELPLPCGESDSPGRLSQQEALGKALTSAQSRKNQQRRAFSSPEKFLLGVQEELGLTVVLGSYGPTAEDKVWLWI